MSYLNPHPAQRQLYLVMDAVAKGNFVKNSKGGVMFFMGDDAKEKMAAYKRKQAKCRKAKEGKPSV